jgi:hypothetical protein
VRLDGRQLHQRRAVAIDWKVPLAGKAFDPEDSGC